MKTFSLLSLMGTKELRCIESPLLRLSITITITISIIVIKNYFSTSNFTRNSLSTEFNWNSVEFNALFIDSKHCQCCICKRWLNSIQTYNWSFSSRFMFRLNWMDTNSNHLFTISLSGKQPKYGQIFDCELQSINLNNY